MFSSFFDMAESMLTTSLIFSVVFFVAALVSALVGLAIRVYRPKKSPQLVDPCVSTPRGASTVGGRFRQPQDHVGIILARCAHVVEPRDRRVVKPHVHVAVGRALVLDVDVAGKRGDDCGEGGGADRDTNHAADMGAARASRQLWSLSAASMTGG